MSFIDSKSLPLSLEFKDLITNFVLDALEERPSNVYEFATLYFRRKLANRPADIGTIIYRGYKPLFRSDLTSVDNIEDVRTNTPRRVAVASESWRPTDRQSYKQPLGQPSEKNSKQKEMLKVLISRVLILRNLVEEDIEEIIWKLNKLVVEKDDIIVSQGDEEDFLFLIEDGYYDVYTVDNSGVLTLVKTFQNQGHFGELALLYNTIETGTIRATTDGVLWCLDRFTFKRIVSQHAYTHLEASIKLLSKISLLKSLNESEKMKIAEAMIIKTFDENTVIFHQGEVGDYIYFIESGRVVVSVKKEDVSVDIAYCGTGSYFGELSLMTNRPRDVTVKTLEKTKVGMIDKECFERLLGPCLDVLERNLSNYEANMAQYFNV